jgi:hypothetical protein
MSFKATGRDEEIYHPDAFKHNKTILSGLFVVNTHLDTTCSAIYTGDSTR